MKREEDHGRVGGRMVGRSGGREVGMQKVWRRVGDALLLLALLSPYKRLVLT